MLLYKHMGYEASIGIPAGKDLERGFVGGDMYLGTHKVERLSYKKAFDQVLKLPQAEPRPVVKSIIREIYKQYPIFEEAGLKYYASIGTAFDYCHGVDCFFMLSLKENEYIVTIDVTQNMSKTHARAKADIIIYIDYDGNGAVTIVGESINDVARKIAETFRRKLSDKRSLKPRRKQKRKHTRH